MLISSETGAAQIVSDHEPTRFYDDIGCLAADWPGHHRDATAFVHVSGGTWTDARAAAYSRPTGSRTAMGFGVVAHTDASTAKAADRDSRAWAWDDVVQRVGERP
jgi:hypothetical protein